MDLHKEQEETKRVCPKRKLETDVERLPVDSGPANIGAHSVIGTIGIAQTRLDANRIGSFYTNRMFTNGLCAGLSHSNAAGDRRNTSSSVSICIGIDRGDGADIVVGTIAIDAARCRTKAAVWQC